VGLIGWLLVGATAGWLAGKATGGGYGILGNIVVGIIGSLLGGFLGGALFGWDVTGLNVGSIVLAFLGAVLFLLILRAIPGLGVRSSPTDAPTVQQSTKSRAQRSQERPSPFGGIPPPPRDIPRASHESAGVRGPVEAKPRDPSLASVVPTGPSTAASLVFISAKNEDYEYATKLYKHLSDHRVPVFFSEESLPALGSSDYRKEIDRALESAQHMVVVTSSKDHVVSGWVQDEWGTFLGELRAGRKAGNLITLVIGSVKAPDLPLGLRSRQVLPYNQRGFDSLLQFLR
jgi:uncharacterized membrane protein YeaQ/YmgE (transglycosylase-associated protein family)